MEIEKELIDSSGKNLINIIFYYEYEGQNLTNNADFEKFKKTMNNKYWDNAKIFKCKDDKILFYNDCSKYPYYEGKCPKCHRNICYFCCHYNKYSPNDCCL